MPRLFPKQVRTAIYKFDTYDDSRSLVSGEGRVDIELTLDDIRELDYQALVEAKGCELKGLEIIILRAVKAYRNNPNKQQDEVLFDVNLSDSDDEASVKANSITKPQMAIIKAAESSGDDTENEDEDDFNDYIMITISPFNLTAEERGMCNKRLNEFMRKLEEKKLLSSDDKQALLSYYNGFIDKHQLIVKHEDPQVDIASSRRNR